MNKTCLRCGNSLFTKAGWCEYCVWKGDEGPGAVLKEAIKLLYIFNLNAVKKVVISNLKKPPATHAGGFVLHQQDETGPKVDCLIIVLDRGVQGWYPVTKFRGKLPRDFIQNIPHQ